MPNYPTDNSTIETETAALSNSAVAQLVVSDPSPIPSASLWIDINSSNWRVRSYPTNAISESGTTINGKSTSTVTSLGTDNKFNWPHICERFECHEIPAGTTIVWYLSDREQGREYFGIQALDISRVVSFNKIAIITEDASLAIVLQITGNAR